jgi:hypothetical protein
MYSFSSFAFYIFAALLKSFKSEAENGCKTYSSSSEITDGYLRVECHICLSFLFGVHRSCSGGDTTLPETHSFGHSTLSRKERNGDNLEESSG